MRMIGTMMVMLCIGAVAGCSSVASTPDPNWAPLQTVFNAQGCPVDVRADTSCANESGATQGSVCREKNHKIAWQAVDEATGSTIRTEFVVRFKAAEQVLDSDSGRAKCSASRRGLLKCKVKNGEPAVSGHEYKYVVQVDDTACAVLDPRLWVN